MKYGKIRIEDGCLIFTRHMMINSLPCRDIVWAYMRREGADGSDARQLLASSLIIVTRRKKHVKWWELTAYQVFQGRRLFLPMWSMMAS